MATDNNPIDDAVAEISANRDPELTDEQRERADENSRRRLEEATLNRAAGDVSQAEAEAREGGVWTEELLNATDPSSRYGILNNLFEVFASFWSPLATFLTGDKDVGDRFARESWMKDEYSPEAGSPIIVADEPREGLAGAQARLQREFPEAAAAEPTRTAEVTLAPTQGLGRSG